MKKKCVYRNSSPEEEIIILSRVAAYTILGSERKMLIDEKLGKPYRPQALHTATALFIDPSTCSYIIHACVYCGVYRNIVGVTVSAYTVSVDASLPNRGAHQSAHRRTAPPLNIAKRAILILARAESLRYSITKWKFTLSGLIDAERIPFSFRLKNTRDKSTISLNNTKV